MVSPRHVLAASMTDTHRDALASRIRRLSPWRWLAALTLGIGTMVVGASAAAPNGLVTVSGTVVTAEGTPIAHAQVAFVPESSMSGSPFTGYAVTYTDAHGHYEFISAPAWGSLYVGNAARDGLVTTPLVPYSGNYFELTIADGVTQQTVDLIYPQYHALTVRVVDAVSGSPVPNAVLSGFADPNTGENSQTRPEANRTPFITISTATALVSSTWPASGTVMGFDNNYSTLKYRINSDVPRTNANGEATLYQFDSSLGAGQVGWHIRAADPAYSGRTGVAAIGQFTADKTITVELPPVVTVSGRVTTTEGTPVAHAQISWVPLSAIGSYPFTGYVNTYTDSEGNYSFASTPAEGSLYVGNASRNGLVTSPLLPLAGFYYRETIVNTASTQALDLTFPQYYALTVTVVDGLTGQPVANAPLSGFADPNSGAHTQSRSGNIPFAFYSSADRLVSSTWPASGSVMTFDNGYSTMKYRINGDRPRTNAQGQAVLYQFASNLGSGQVGWHIRATDPASTSRTGSTPIGTFTSDKAITIELPAQVTVSGQVTTHTGVPIAHAQVAYVPLASIGISPFTGYVVTYTDTQGRYSFTAAPGQGSLYVGNASRNGLVTTPLVPLAGFYFEFDVQTGAPTQNGDLVFPAYYAMTINVIDAASGEPVPNALLTGYADPDYGWNMQSRPGDTPFYFYSTAGRLISSTWPASGTVMGFDNSYSYLKYRAQSDTPRTNAQGQATLYQFDSTLGSGQNLWYIKATDPVNQNRFAAVATGEFIADKSLTIAIPSIWGTDLITPVISGEARVGSDLTASPGAWHASVPVTYQWLSDGQPVDGATSATYTVTDADAGSTLSVRVTGTSGDASLTRTSAVTEPVVIPEPETVLLTSPEIDDPNLAQAGVVLTPAPSSVVVVVPPAPSEPTAPPASATQVTESPASEPVASPPTAPAPSTTTPSTPVLEVAHASTSTEQTPSPLPIVATPDVTADQPATVQPQLAIQAHAAASVQSSATSIGQPRAVRPMVRVTVARGAAVVRLANASSLAGTVVRIDVRRAGETRYTTAGSVRVTRAGAAHLRVRATAGATIRLVSGSTVVGRASIPQAVPVVTTAEKAPTRPSQKTAAGVC